MTIDVVIDDHDLSASLDALLKAITAMDSTHVTPTALWMQRQTWHILRMLQDLKDGYMSQQDKTISDGRRRLFDLPVVYDDYLYRSTVRIVGSERLGML